MNTISKSILITLLLLGLDLTAQLRPDSVYKYGYRLNVPSTEAYQYMEYESINWADTGNSFSQYLDSSKYIVNIITLNDWLKPAPTLELAFLDLDGNILKEYQNPEFLDSLLVELPRNTNYIVFYTAFKKDTVYFSFHSDQIPKRITLIPGRFNGLTRPILRCKRRLSPNEMDDIYKAIRFNKTAQIDECGICQLMFEI